MIYTTVMAVLVLLPLGLLSLYTMGQLIHVLLAVCLAMALLKCIYGRESDRR